MSIRGAPYEVTVWNEWKDPANKNHVEYIRHVVPRCSWEVEIVRTVSGMGPSASAAVGNTYNVMIDENPNYRPFAEWNAMSAENRRRYFTLNTGELVARGNVSIEITGVTPYKKTDVETSQRPNAFRISAIADETESYKKGRHIEVVGV